jgi:putative serine protease PepD
MSTEEHEPVPGFPVPPIQGQPADDEPLPVCDYTDESDAPCEEPVRARAWSSAAVVTGAAIGSVVGGLLVAAGMVWTLGLIPGVTPLKATPSISVSVPATLSISPTGQALDVPEAVASKVVPSVVNITIFEQRTNQFTGQTAVVEAGNGSGVIIRENGYILTNYHVVQNSDKVVVTVGVEDKVATIVGVDPTTDLAVIKIDGTGYPAVELGTSGDLRVGQFVMAIGSPFGLDKTVTSGIISALQRSEQIPQGTNLPTTYANLIQTDAAINPGNSGGALVDSAGRLVGINTLIQSPSGGVGAAQSAGIGFAIPVDFAASIADQLIADGKASHPYLGVSTQTVNEAVATQYQLPVQSGALVVLVQPGGPSDKAKIKRGDIITKIGDTSITGVADVFAATRLHKIGDPVSVELVRADQKLTVKVQLGSDANR